MGNFFKVFPSGVLGKHAWERQKKVKEITERLTHIAKANRNEGERFKIIARPYQRRSTLDTTFNVGVSIKMEVEIRAINEQGHALEITRIWTTKNGKNKDIRRPSKGKGKNGDLGPYVVEYKPSSAGLSKFKVATAGDLPSIVYYIVRQANLPAGSKLPKAKGQK